MCKTLFQRSGGHSTSLGLCPTKLPVKWDIQLGPLDVPAFRNDTKIAHCPTRRSGCLGLQDEFFKNFPVADPEFFQLRYMTDSVPEIIWLLATIKQVCVNLCSKEAFIFSTKAAKQGVAAGTRVCHQRDTLAFLVILGLIIPAYLLNDN